MLLKPFILPFSLLGLISLLCISCTLPSKHAQNPHLSEYQPKLKRLTNAHTSIKVYANLQELNAFWDPFSRLIKGEKGNEDQSIQEWEKTKQGLFDQYPALKNTEIWGISPTALRLTLTSFAGYQKLKEWVNLKERDTTVNPKQSAPLQVDAVIDLVIDVSDQQRFTQAWKALLQGIEIKPIPLKMPSNIQGFESLAFEAFVLSTTQHPLKAWINQSILFWIKPNSDDGKKTRLSIVLLNKPLEDVYNQPLNQDIQSPQQAVNLNQPVNQQQQLKPQILDLLFSTLLFLNEQLKPKDSLLQSNQNQQENQNPKELSLLLDQSIKATLYTLSMDIDFRELIDFLAVLQSQSEEYAHLPACIDAFSHMIDAYQALSLKLMPYTLNIDFQLTQSYAKLLKQSMVASIREINQIGQAPEMIDFQLTLSPQRLNEQLKQAHISNFNRLCAIQPFSYLMPIYAFPIGMTLEDLWIKEILNALQINSNALFDLLHLQLYALDSTSIFPKIKALWLSDPMEQIQLEQLSQQGLIQAKHQDEHLKHWLMTQPFALSYQQKSINAFKNESKVLYQLSIGLPPSSFPDFLSFDQVQNQDFISFLKLYFDLSRLKSIIDFRLHHILNVIINRFKALVLDGNIEEQMLRYQLQLDTF